MQSFNFFKNNKIKPHINQDDYDKLYQKSIENSDEFWAEMAEEFITFEKKWDKVSDYSFDPENLYIKWFEGAKLNVCYNCVDRHLPQKANDTAIIWEGDNPEEDKKITYSELKLKVSKFSNILKNLGAKKGDVVTIYMPMIPEAAFAMLACARIGAVHSVVFGGFSPEALKGRIEDGNSKLIITADEGVRGGKNIPLKSNVDEAVKDKGDVKILTVARTKAEIIKINGRDYDYDEEYQKADDNCECEIMDAEDPLFILYTSGSTGKPKGLMHSSAGYILYTAVTHKYCFDYKDGDIYWCTADIGWVTGHSYIIYGPLANGATTLMFEGVPTYPDVSRFWKVCEKHKVNQFYTAPTAIRALMSHGQEPVNKHNLSDLRILGTVGEPINPEAWRWYFEVVGKSKCPIVDTWWQTETGGFLITPLPYATELKPGAATKPFFGIIPVIVDNENMVLQGGDVEGNLCINQSWPSQARTIWGDHKRFSETYFQPFNGRYFSGDGAKRDEDGFYRITGRVDDVINVSGHRLGTAEIESALVLHKAVCEAAVVGYPHEVKGQGVYAFVTLMDGYKESSELENHLENELKEFVKKEIGPIAKPDIIQFAHAVPKTRSGKIMRRILRKIAANDYENLGDTKTLLNPEAVETLIENRINK